jgi:MFS family permease
MSSSSLSLVGASPAALARRDPYAAFRHKPYRHFVLGRVIFMIGSQMQTTAVGWQIYERLGAKLALAYVGLVQVVPILLLAVPFGHLSDRFNRKFLVMAGQGIFLLSSLGLAALSHFRGDPYLIYIFLFLLAVARSLTMPAMGALLPTLIPKAAWASAATWNSSVFELTGMMGPAVAGLVIAASGGATAVYLTAAGCSITCLVIFSFLRPAQTIAPKKSATWGDVLGGLRFVFKTRLLLSAASLDLFAVLLGGATALLPVVAKDILHVGPAGFGWLRAAPSIGAISMALITAHLPPWRHAGRVLLGALTGFGLAIIVFGFSHNFWLSMAMLVLTGVFDNLNVVIRQTLVQFITPDEMRGRVTSVNFIFIGCSNELGGFESGLTAQLFGTVPSIVGGGVGTILVVLTILKLSPQLRKLGRLHEIQPAPA